MPQVTCRVTQEELNAFNHACKGQSVTAQAQLKAMIDMYISQSKHAAILHLDGHVCPITMLIDSLAEAAIGRMKPPTPTTARPT
jgi:hypothetical protein